MEPRKSTRGKALLKNYPNSLRGEQATATGGNEVMEDDAGVDGGIGGEVKGTLWPGARTT